MVDPNNYMKKGNRDNIFNRLLEQNIEKNYSVKFPLLNKDYMN
jgi:hypothetical protein